MRMTVRVRDLIVDHAQCDQPLECCGLLAAHEDILCSAYACDNAAESETRYEIDGQQQFHTHLQIEQAGLDLAAIYHSHTHAPPVPSQMDVATAFHPHLLYVIVGVQDEPEVRGFWIRDGNVTEEEIVVA